MVAGVVNMLFSSMSTGRREEGATVSKRVFSTPRASGESRWIWGHTTYTLSLMSAAQQVGSATP